MVRRQHERAGQLHGRARAGATTGCDGIRLLDGQRQGEQARPGRLAGVPGGRGGRVGARGQSFGGDGASGPLHLVRRLHTLPVASSPASSSTAGTTWPARLGQRRDVHLHGSRPGGPGHTAAGDRAVRAFRSRAGHRERQQPGRRRRKWPAAEQPDRWRQDEPTVEVVRRRDERAGEFDCGAGAGDASAGGGIRLLDGQRQGEQARSGRLAGVPGGSGGRVGARAERVSSDGAGGSLHLVRRLLDVRPARFTAASTVAATAVATATSAVRAWDLPTPAVAAVAVAIATSTDAASTWLLQPSAGTSTSTAAAMPRHICLRQQPVAGVGDARLRPGLHWRRRVRLRLLLDRCRRMQAEEVDLV